MTKCSRCLLIAVALLIGPLPGAWAQGPASAGRSGEADIQKLQQLAKRLQDGKRVRQTLAEVRDRFPAIVAGADIDDALQKMETAAYEREPQRRVAAVEAAATALRLITNKLIDALPPAAVVDNLNDDGTKLMVVWRPVEGAATYKIERRDLNADGTEREPWHARPPVEGARQYYFLDDEHIRSGRKYEYRVTAVGGEGQEVSASTTPQPGVASATIFDDNKLWFLLLVVAPITGFVMLYIQLAKSGVQLTIRKLAGLDAVDEAVGRATEMGRPILFVPGIQDMNDIQTVAGLIVLGRVARTAAERDAILEVPTCRSLVMTAAREMVQNAYMEVGRPDTYDERKIYYTTDEQFGYVAAVTGTMVREAPATCFYMGSFFAESLILAETGNLMGSIQIAGTAQPSQLPFFVAACDYTLLGEELFAASAYLSGEPMQLGSLKGQDMGKLLAGVLICVGVLLVTAVVLLQDDFGTLGAWRDWLIERVLRAAE